MRPTMSEAFAGLCAACVEFRDVFVADARRNWPLLVALIVTVDLVFFTVMMLR